MKWDAADFALFGAMLVAACYTFELTARMTANTLYRAAVGVTVAAARERSVVGLIAEGHGNRKAAQILGVSQKTVEGHRAAAMRKAKVNSTAHLVRYAVRNRLVEP